LENGEKPEINYDEIKTKKERRGGAQEVKE